MAYEYKIIDGVYHRTIIGYGSIKSVYKEATSINTDIIVNDVKDYFSKLQSRQVQFKYKRIQFICS